MGCWSSTCMISNLPISYQDEIKLIILKPRNNIPSIIGCSGYVYSNDLLDPAFFQLSGTYNDYGLIENIEKDWNYELIENYCKKTYGKKIFIDRKTEEDWDLLKFLRGIEREGMKDEKDEPINLSFVMIRKDIWDFICKKSKKTIDFYQKKFDEYFKNEKFGDLFIQFNNLFFGHKLADPCFLASEEYTDFVFQKENRKKVFDLWIDLQLINNFIIHNRRGWMIQPGQGSQTENWQEAISFSEEIIKIAKNKIKQYQ